LLCAQGDALVSLDADLQDDLAAIPQMIEAHLAGADVVYGVRCRRDVDTRFKRWSAHGYYALLRRFGVDVVPDHADFRLMSRRALDGLRGFREVNLFLRGIIPLLGFRTATVAYDRLPRLAGESKYPLHKMIALALDGILAFSSAPLRWITALGLLVSAASMAFGLWAIAVRLLNASAVPGWASIVVPIFFLGGLQLLALGIIGEYLARIYAETKQRPRFIIEKIALTMRGMRRCTGSRFSDGHRDGLSGHADVAVEPPTRHRIDEHEAAGVGLQHCRAGPRRGPEQHVGVALVLEARPWHPLCRIPWCVRIDVAAEIPIAHDLRQQRREVELHQNRRAAPGTTTHSAGGPARVRWDSRGCRAGCTASCGSAGCAPASGRCPGSRGRSAAGARSRAPRRCPPPSR
jgi:hypothetical protein